MKIIIIIIILLVLGIIATYQGLVVRKYEIKSYKIKSNVRIVMLSDIHESTYGKNNKKLFDKIVSLSPDIICLCGDILDKQLLVPSTQILIKSLAGNFPCYYVTRKPWSKI